MTGGARAQAWPAKTIKIVCGFPAGGLTDTFACAYGAHLSEKLGQSVIIENRAGAGGAIAARAVKDAAPDGYTLMFTIAATMLQNRVLYKNLGYDADKDFVLISHMSSGHLPLFVRPNLGINTLAELAALAKRSDVSLGTFGPGTQSHVMIGEINRHFGLEMKAVHYRGEAPMFQDVASGALHGGIGTYSAALSLVDAKLAKPIAVPTLKRMSKFPDVQTYAEQGLKSQALVTQGFTAFVGPLGLPVEIVERLSTLMVEGGKTPRVQKILENFGIDNSALDHKEFARIYKEVGPLLIQQVPDLNLPLVE